MRSGKSGKSLQICWHILEEIAGPIFGSHPGLAQGALGSCRSRLLLLAARSPLGCAVGGPLAAAGAF